ncbi:MOSC domain-containing protein [Candidatus Bipolaricaulota bacterium]|nr:MOSC domain-containing protein [Candidatus Bipolaricaulota bacterium]
MKKDGRVVAVCISDRKGVPKMNVDRRRLLADYGLEGDAHAGGGKRQVSLLALESIEKMRAKGLDVSPGSFAENITTSGIVLFTLPVGTRMRIGSVLVEVTQIGKDCHSRCAIYYQAGDCVMPREGIFVKVLASGEAAVGDGIGLLSDRDMDEGGR